MLEAGERGVELLPTKWVGLCVVVRNACAYNLGVDLEIPYGLCFQSRILNSGSSKEMP